MIRFKLPRKQAAQTPPAPKQTPTTTGRPGIQQWLPVRNVQGGLIVRSDGQVAAAVRIDPVPFSLLSDRERERRIGALHEALQGLPALAQFVVVPRPIDLDGYIGSLEAGLTDAQGPRRTLLRDYTAYVRRLAGGGQAIERRFYVLLTGDGRRRAAREELLSRVAEFVSALGRAELQAHQADDREIIDLLYTWLHPVQAAFERADPFAGTVMPIYEFIDGEAGDDGAA